jgi:hypothetical protein
METLHNLSFGSHKMMMVIAEYKYSEMYINGIWFAQ